MNHPGRPSVPMSPGITPKFPLKSRTKEALAPMGIPLPPRTERASGELILNFGLSPNSLSNRRAFGDKCSVISWARKKSPLACKHKAHIPLKPWRGCPSILRSYLFSRPRYALRKKGLGSERGDIPPVLAAQSAFPSGPFRAWPANFDQRIGR